MRRYWRVVYDFNGQLVMGSIFSMRAAINEALNTETSLVLRVEYYDADTDETLYPVTLREWVGL